MARKIFVFLVCFVLLSFLLTGIDGLADKRVSDIKFGFGFEVDPQTGTVKLDTNVPDVKLLSAQLLPSRVLAQGEEATVYNCCSDEDLAQATKLTEDIQLELTDYDDNTQTMDFRDFGVLEIVAKFKNVTEDEYFLQPFCFKIDEDNTTLDKIESITLPAVGDDAELGDDGALSPGEETAELEFVVRHKGEPFSFYVDAYALVVSVDIDINNTPDENDDITVLIPQATEAWRTFEQPIEARVRLYGARGEVTLAVSPTGRATLDKDTLDLEVEDIDTVTITPTANSEAANDVWITASFRGVQVGAEDMTIVWLHVPLNIRRDNTPDGMPDRIPPRVDTSFFIQVEPDLSSSGGQVVTLAVNGQSNENGTVTISGSATHDVTTSGIVDLRGITQTANTTAGAGGGHAGNLVLVAQVRGENTQQSQGFSVAAIPENWSCRLIGPLITYTDPETGTVYNVRGMVVKDEWESDSGVLGDLDSVKISEQVQDVNPTGVFQNYTLTFVSGYLEAKTTISAINRHWVGLGGLTGAGTWEHRQTSMFLDTRTGSVDIPMTNSGFIIRFEVFDADPDPNVTDWWIRTRKVGANVTANGVTSNAGQALPTATIFVDQDIP